MLDRTPGDPVPLLKAMIARPSVTPETAGVLDLLDQTLTALGFAVTRLRFEGDGSYPVDNLFAIRGKGGRKLLFAGHTDVVPPGDVSAWSHDPFSAAEVDGEIFGRGAVDMKSGIATFIAAVERAIADGSADLATIALAITNDEEADAINGTAKLLEWVEAQGYKFDFAIVGEPSSAAVVGDSIKIGRRGSFSGKITVTGVQGHVAYPDKANNPLPVLAAAVSAVSSARLDTGTEHFPPSNLEVTSIDVGNPTGNVIPAKGHFLFNIRFNDLWTPDKLSAWIGDKIASVDAHGCAIVFEMAGIPSRSFLSPLSGDVETLGDVIAAETGSRPQQSTGGGTSDARFVAQYCPVVECGLVGTTMHKVDERVVVEDLFALTRIYTRFIGAFVGRNQ
jgi:succinyl-diaminopimelate desuccinylase